MILEDSPALDRRFPGLLWRCGYAKLSYVVERFIASRNRANRLIWLTLSLLAIFGFYADCYDDRKVPFFLGLLAMSAATIFFIVSFNVYALLVARFLQGIAGAVLGVIGLTLMFESVDKENTGVAMGFMSIAMTSSIIFAPVLGGVMYAYSASYENGYMPINDTLTLLVSSSYDAAGYYAVFVLPIVFLCVDLLFRLLLIEKKGEFSQLSICQILNADSNKEAARWKTKETHTDASATPVGYASSPNTKAQDPLLDPGVYIQRTSATSSTKQDDMSKTPLLPQHPTKSVPNKPSRLRVTVRLLSEPRLLVAIETIFASFSVITALEAVWD